LPGDQTGLDGKIADTFNAMRGNLTAQVRNLAE